jgi:long-chain acyl-CoA synthetase
MLDVSRFSELKPAPRAVFDELAERRERARFMVQASNGEWQKVTYGDFASQIEKIASFLCEIGFQPGERGAVFAPNRVEWMSAALAIQAAGGVLVPIYPASTAEQAAYVLSHSDARIVFVDTPALLARVMERRAELPNLKHVVYLGASEESGVTPLQQVLTTAAKPEEFAKRLATLSLEQSGLMLYTSGTTGNPKGVPLTHANVGVSGLDWLNCNAPLLEEGAVDVLWLPMSHIFGFGAACLGNTLGFTTYLSDPMNALKHLAEVRPSVFMSVPAYWEKIAQAVIAETDPTRRRAKVAEVTGGNLRFCLSGGAGLKRELKELLHESGVLIIEGYGLTECSPTLTLNRPGDFRFDSVGKALPSVELKLAEDGEILAKGPNVFAGYHKDEAATREVFTDDGWFKTGDVGRFTEDGFLQIVDRKKEILVTAGGKNVPPANIEQRFRDDPIVEHVIVYGDGKRYLVAGVWLNPEAVDAKLVGVQPSERQSAIDALVNDSVARVNQHLASFEQVKRHRVMDASLTVAGGLLTSTLKPRRKHIYAAFEREFESMYES